MDKEHFKAICEETGLRPEAFARALRISLDTYKSYRCGRLRVPEDVANRARMLAAGICQVINSIQ